MKLNNIKNITLGLLICLVVWTSCNLPQGTGRARYSMKNYVDQTKGIPLRDNFTTALQIFSNEFGQKKVKHRLTAADLGAGAGNETMYLLEKGWDVIAVDIDPYSIETIRERYKELINNTETGSKEKPGSLDARLIPMQRMELKPDSLDLVNASLSLPFIPRAEMKGVWIKIVKALRDGGVFTGNFFGPEHAWRNNPNLSFYSLEEIKNEFLKDSNLEIKDIFEEKKATRVAVGGTVLFHTITVIVQKKGNVKLPDMYAFRNVHLFDGQEVIENTNVLVRSGLIVNTGKSIDIPKKAIVIDGTGKTLLPGLIDAHAHIFGDGAAQSLKFGVTTNIDMFMDVRLMQEFKRQQAAGFNPGRSDLISAGTVATVPGGHGTEYGRPIPTLTKPDEAQAFVDDRIAEGSDFIKIIYDPAGKFPSLDKATMAALIQAAHIRKKLTAVHIRTLQDASDAIESGADILAHVWHDREVSAEVLALARNNHIVLIPTFTVINSVCGLRPGQAILDDELFKPFISPFSLNVLKRRFPFVGGNKASFNRALINAGKFRENNLLVLAGTDAPNPGTTYGASLHQELEFFVQAGFSPAEALNAATALPAKVFGLGDRGRIAKGLRADLLLVEGNPLEDIKNTRRIAGIWKNGVELDRNAY